MENNSWAETRQFTKEKVEVFVCASKEKKIYSLLPIQPLPMKQGTCSSCSGRLSCEKGRFPQPLVGEHLVFNLSVSAPGKPRPQCPTSLSASCQGDPSLNSPTGLEGESIDLARETHQQHKEYPSAGLPLCLLPTASAREGLTLTVYGIILFIYIIENCDGLRFEDSW